MSLYVVAYDIVNSKRRRRVAKVLGRYGKRIQKSVFAASLAGETLAELKCRVGPLLGKNDAFAILPLDQRAERPTIWWLRPGFDSSPVLLV